MVVSIPIMQQYTIITEDGQQLSALYGCPIDGAIGTVLLSAATGIKKEYYLPFSYYLIQQGYNVLLYDYRGIGGSAATDLRLSKACLHEWGIFDMNAALNFLVKEKGLTEITWLGHSMGAQLVGFIHEPHHLKKVIALNAALGYYGYFPLKKRIKIWFLWYVAAPILTTVYGYAPMKKIGWGENLPTGILMEWRSWCTNKYYFRALLRKRLQTDSFENFKVPINVVYCADDYIANDFTATAFMQFYPAAPKFIQKLMTTEFTQEEVGHTGIFRKKFSHCLWDILLNIIEAPVPSHA